MKGMRWVFGAVAAASLVALVAPAVGQGRTDSASLRWSASNGAAAVSSYDLGTVDVRPPVGKGFRLWDSSWTRSGPLAIKLTGSRAFSIGIDNCTGVGIGKQTSCWVGVVYKPSGVGTSDSATLTAAGRHGAIASVTISGSGAAPSPGHLYWVGSGSPNAVNVGSVNKVSRGGAAPTPLVSGLTGASTVAVDGTNVYWVSGAVYPDTSVTLYKVPVGGGSVTPLAKSQNSPTSIAVDGTNVYWVTYSGGTVNEVPAGGGSVITLASGQSAPLAIATDGARVYWSTSDGAVRDVPVGGGTVTTLATGQDANSLALDGTYLYWTNDGTGDSSFPAGGTVNRIPLGGGTVTTLANHQNVPFSVAVDGTHVYWVTWVGGTVNEVPLGGGGVTTLASHQTYPRSLAVDGTHVYWIDGWGFERVKKLRLGSPSVAVLGSGENLNSLALGP